MTHRRRAGTRARWAASPMGDGDRPPHTRRMRARASRGFAATVSAVVIVVARRHPGRAGSGPVRTLRCGARRGAGHRSRPAWIRPSGSLVCHTGSRSPSPSRMPARPADARVVAWVETSTSVAATAPVDLAPGETVTTGAVVQVSGLPGRRPRRGGHRRRRDGRCNASSGALAVDRCRRDRDPHRSAQCS